MLHAHLFDFTDFALSFAYYATCLCFVLGLFGTFGINRPEWVDATIARSLFALAIIESTPELRNAPERETQFIFDQIVGALAARIIARITS